MTNEQINIAIAEACGYEWRVGIYGNCRGLFHPDDNYLKEQPCLDMVLPISSDCAKKVPNYCNDLNAMHEAEKYIMDESSILYKEELEKVSCIWHSTAKQKAIAFLKAIGKWKE